MNLKGIAGVSGDAFISNATEMPVRHFGSAKTETDSRCPQQAQQSLAGMTLPAPAQYK